MNDILTGAWVYRSFHNVQGEVDPKLPLEDSLLFGQGDFVFDPLVRHDNVRGPLAFPSDPPSADDARQLLERSSAQLLTVMVNLPLATSPVG